jgi:methyl-accepting chemotaxis protein
MPELPSIAEELLPVLLLGLIFVYSLATLLIITALLIVSMLRARFRLTEAVTNDQLLAVLAQTGLKRLGPQIVDPAAFERATGICSQYPFGRVRRPILHLYRNRLMRVQFFTGVAGLLAISAMGWAKDYLHITQIEIAIPAGPAFVAALVLILLFVIFGEMAVDVTGKALLGRISEIPSRNASRSTLLIPAEGERVGPGSLSGSVATPFGAIAPILDSIERLMEVIERRRSSLREPMLQLSASAEAMTAMAKALSERAFDTAQAGTEFRAAIDRLTAKIEQLAERPAEMAQAATQALGNDELKTAIERLTAKIEQLTERPAETAQAATHALGSDELKTAIDRLTAKIEQLAERPAETAQAATYALGSDELKTAIDRLTAKIEQAGRTRSRSSRGDRDKLRNLLKEFE